MADESAASETQITFNIKSSSEAKYVLTVPESMTVQNLKTKLSTPEYANLPVERQRLIYSGRVLKDAETLGSYKIKDGNTVHLVRGADSNQRQTSASQPNTSSRTPGTVPGAGVPQNLATGTGNDPLAGLTGARYAGFAQMPGAGMFGPDGGMGAPPDPERMLEMLENPMFQSQMNEAMNNPAVIQMMQNNPMLRDQPMMREMLNNPEMRRMMMDPQFIRQSMAMSRLMNGGRAGGATSFPAPGVTDTTSQDASATGGGTTATPDQTNTTGTPQSPPLNPFAMFGGGQGTGAQGNPFASLFGMPPQANTNSAPASNTSTTPTTATNPASTDGSQPQSQQPNPFGSLFGMPGQPQQQQQQQQQDNPFAAMTQNLMQNPQAMQQAMEQMRQMGLMGGGTGVDGAQGNPFASLFGSMPASSSSPPPPPDPRPPEERYAEQLRQLNDMGFFEFERNIRALQRSGGSVQGAVEALLSDI